MPVYHCLYRELFQFVLKLLPDLPHTARKRLVWLAFGILLAKRRRPQSHRDRAVGILRRLRGCREP